MANGTMTAASPVTGSAGVDLSPYMAQLQQDFGSFDPNNVQTRRRGYYSFKAYPTAGQAVFGFFTDTIGTTSRQLTNIQRSGHLDNPFIVRAIRTRYYIAAANQSAWTGLDADTIYSDLVNGLFQCGFLRIVIGAKEWMQLPCPFLYAPPAYGAPRVDTSGFAAANVSSGPFAYLPSGDASAYLVDPAFMIGSDQNFQMTLEYPGGNMPVIGTNVVTGNAILYVGLELDGIDIRPLQ